MKDVMLKRLLVWRETSMMSSFTTTMKPGRSHRLNASASSSQSWSLHVWLSAVSCIRWKRRTSSTVRKTYAAGEGTKKVSWNSGNRSKRNSYPKGRSISSKDSQCSKWSSTETGKSEISMGSLFLWFSCQHSNKARNWVQTKNIMTTVSKLSITTSQD